MSKRRARVPATRKTPQYHAGANWIATSLLLAAVGGGWLFYSLAYAPSGHQLEAVALVLVSVAALAAAPDLLIGVAGWLDKPKGVFEKWTKRLRWGAAGGGVLIALCVIVLLSFSSSTFKHAYAPVLIAGFSLIYVLLALAAMFASFFALTAQEKNLLGAETSRRLRVGIALTIFLAGTGCQFISIMQAPPTH